MGICFESIPGHPVSVLAPMSAEWCVGAEGPVDLLWLLLLRLPYYCLQRMANKAVDDGCAWGLHICQVKACLLSQSLPIALSLSIASDPGWLGCFHLYASGSTFWYNVTVLVKMDFDELLRVDSHLLNHSRLLHSMVCTNLNAPLCCLFCPHFCHSVTTTCFIVITLLASCSCFVLPDQGYFAVICP